MCPQPYLSRVLCIIQPMRFAIPEPKRSHFFFIHHSTIFPVFIVWQFSSFFPSRFSQSSPSSTQVLWCPTWLDVHHKWRRTWTRCKRIGHCTNLPFSARMQMQNANLWIVSENAKMRLSILIADPEHPPPVHLLQQEPLSRIELNTPFIHLIEKTDTNSPSHSNLKH